MCVRNRFWILCWNWKYSYLKCGKHPNITIKSRNILFRRKPRSVFAFANTDSGIVSIIPTLFTHTQIVKSMHIPPSRLFMCCLKKKNIFLRGVNLHLLGIGSKLHSLHIIIWTSRKVSVGFVRILLLLLPFSCCDIWNSAYTRRLFATRSIFICLLMKVSSFRLMSN